MSFFMILSVFMLSSCGTVPEYKTKHESGTFKIHNAADFDKLAFKSRTSPSEIARLFPDFCIYDNKDGSNKLDWAASCYVDFVDIDSVYKFDIWFNADKEFMVWDLYIDSVFLDWLKLNYNSEINYTVNEFGTITFEPFGNFEDQLLGSFEKGELCYPRHFVA